MGFDWATELKPVARTNAERDMGTIQRDVEASGISSSFVPADFWRRIKRYDNGGCWVWQGAKSAKGYGRMKVGGALYSPHRIAYALSKGPVPKGVLVRHRCDNPPCCNPDHLELGSYRDNAQDTVKRGRCPPPANKGVYRSLASVPLETIVAVRASGLSRRAAAERFGLGEWTIRRIVALPSPLALCSRGGHG